MDQKRLVDANELAMRLEKLAQTVFIPYSSPIVRGCSVDTRNATAELSMALQTEINNNVTKSLQKILLSIANEVRNSTKTVNECMLCQKKDWEEDLSSNPSHSH